MRKITKGPPPDCVSELRRTPGATWRSVTGVQKRQMREVAFGEQRGVCAYCNRRIDLTARTTMEHWRPRADRDTDPFGWADLLAVCPGLPDDQTCDRRRGDRPLRLHPAGTDPHPELVVRLLKDGRIISDDSVRHDVEEILGLMNATLVASRKKAVDGVLQKIGTKGGLREALAVVNDPNQPLPPFPTLVLPLLQQAAKARASTGNRLKKRPR